MLLSQLPLQVWVLALAVLGGVLQRLVLRRPQLLLSPPPPLPASARASAQDRTVFVCLVGTEPHALRALAQAIRGSAARPHAVSVGLVVVVRSAEQVREERRGDDGDEGVSLTWMYASRPATALVDARREALRTLYRGERYVLLLHGCNLLPEWDGRCLPLLDREEEEHGTGRRRLVVLTSFPVATRRDDAHALFPRLRVDADDAAVHVDTRPMALRRDDVLTPAAVWSRALSLCSRRTLQACLSAPAHGKEGVLFRRGQLEQTVALAGAGVRIVTPAFAVAVRASKFGVGAPAGTLRMAAMDAHPAFGAHPHAGLVYEDDDEERILKYGGVDVARVLLHEQRAQRDAAAGRDGGESDGDEREGGGDGDREGGGGEPGGGGEG